MPRGPVRKVCRIHSPVGLIEYDQQAAGPIGKAIGNSDTVPTRNHIQSLLRTPEGTDYGKDLLRQHYAQSAYGSLTRGLWHSLCAPHDRLPSALQA